MVVNGTNLRSLIISALVSPFSCTWKARSKFWDSWVFSRWRNTHIQAPSIQNTGNFRRQTSFKLIKGKSVTVNLDQIRRQSYRE